MKLFLPKQHGAWAMLIIPFWLGIAASGFIWQHIPFFIGWILLYLATYPMLFLFKKKKIPYYTKWTCIYFVPAIFFLLFPLFERPTIIWFGVAMIPFFIINAYFSSREKDRALLNDISAIFAFGLAGLGSGFLPDGNIHTLDLIVFIASMLFFIGSTFYVKTMIREKRNQDFKFISWGYHFIIVLLSFIFGYGLIALALLPSLIRSILFYGKPYSAKKVGILEIVNAAWFFLIIIIFVYI